MLANYFQLLRWSVLPHSTRTPFNRLLVTKEESKKQDFGHHLPVDFKVVNPTGMTVGPTFNYTLDLFYTLSF